MKPQFRALVLLAAFGGMRRGELLALTRRDIDLLHRTVTVRLQHQESKGGGHLVGPLRLVVWQRDWTRARRVLGLQGVRLHDLRHVAGTMAAATGASTKELMHRLGHASPRAALRYQHATAKRDEAIADGIDRILDAAQREGESSGNVLRFRDDAAGS